MLIGVISFSYANGSLSSILTSYDVQNAALQERLDILKSIKKEFNIPQNLYMTCKKNVQVQENDNQ